mgnify:CR=1 FL=1
MNVDLEKENEYTKISKSEKQNWRGNIKMAMTGNVEFINNWTHGNVEGIGKIICGGREFSPNYEDEKILDNTTYNFHLFPDMEVLSEEDKNLWLDYFDRVREMRKKIIEELKNKIENVETIDWSEYKNPSRIKKYNSTTYYLAENVGKNGVLDGISNVYISNGFNQFFRCIPIYKNRRYYSINFMRFYLDNECKVNCIFDQVQFDSSKNGNVNSECEINYPKTYKGQNEKMIRLSKKGACVYNPRQYEDVKEVVDSFVKFIKKVDDEDKWQEFCEKFNTESLKELEKYCKEKDIKGKIYKYIFSELSDISSNGKIEQYDEQNNEVSKEYLEYYWIKSDDGKRIVTAFYKDFDHRFGNIHVLPGRIQEWELIDDGQEKSSRFDYSSWKGRKPYDEELEGKMYKPKLEEQDVQEDDVQKVFKKYKSIYNDIVTKRLKDGTKEKIASYSGKGSGKYKYLYKWTENVSGNDGNQYFICPYKHVETEMGILVLFDGKPRAYQIKDDDNKQPNKKENDKFVIDYSYCKLNELDFNTKQ